MPSFPYFPNPFLYRKYTYNNYTNNVIKQNPYKYVNNQNKNNKETEYKKHNNDTFLFDIFGIKLYFDDILLLCLIFFLYNEGVKDEGLFFALILLLLT